MRVPVRVILNFVFQGIVPTQGLNLRWQVDSLPLRSGEPRGRICESLKVTSKIPSKGCKQKFGKGVILFAS